MKNKNVPSLETQQEALKIAKATQKPGQTKEQTRLIAQGIEKGIALYKKQQKERARAADKAKKKAQKAKQAPSTVGEPSPPSTSSESVTPTSSNSAKIAWGLLMISWLGFIAYVSQQ
ncbi:DUF2956 domain-containing protein [Vibrio sinaloensis]|uniref:DUF2956 domain-containing protein n=1 Tax=Photobacterium sp. (strain ATCC 43367) TaxID=379097 RepID=UPI0020657892|nr:DUF2956 domain-containing protein [Vibrio sinaloensis]UPQ87271.1 DUF2956 domain-containing protein [Vibrio sinaloensis]